MIYWEKKERVIGRRRARKREGEMRCHWGIPLSSPVFPPLSWAVHLISPSVSFSHLPLLLTLFSHFQCKLSPLCDPRHLALLCLLLALSLVVYLSSLPLPLSPSLTVRADMELFNEHSSAPATCSSIISLQFLHVVSLFTTTQHCV